MLRRQFSHESGKTALVKAKEESDRRRTRSLNAPSPIQQFGPCGRIMKNSAMVMQIQDPASQRLTWYKPPLTVLVIKKVHDAGILAPFVQLVHWLVHEKSMVVFVEAAVLDDTLLKEYGDFSQVRERLMTFRAGTDELTDKIDFIICLGGDGTLLHASSLFQQSVPPVMAFHLGSLGFLTPFEFNNFQDQVMNVLEGHAALTLRSRLQCVVLRKCTDDGKEKKKPTTILVLNEVVVDRGPSPYLSNIDLFLDGKHITSVQGDGVQKLRAQWSPQSQVRLEIVWLHGKEKKKPTTILVLNEVVVDRGPSPYLSNIDLFLDGKYITSVQGDVTGSFVTTVWVVNFGKVRLHGKEKKKPTTILVLNEVVVDRGPSPYLSNIDLFLDGKHITSVQGDGLIVSTPTGSTAYAVAAGASMIHPSVPAIMVTPICPHSLSFRPIVVPAGVELKITPSVDARCPASVSFDGRNQVTLRPGDSLYVTTSVYPVPSICAQDQISDWFDSLAECLHWNVRKRQKNFDELSDLTCVSDQTDETDHNHQDERPTDT
ncbi:unnamed protein product [Plutella xylostella]|uniref:NAD(+) kinase n=1 Tax=Plutella xylostella TaxID=51655 RepID=A0A8S4E8S9_PLUXY|nr:unnamed protein product [Plutella xylostella]